MARFGLACVAVAITWGCAHALRRKTKRSEVSEGMQGNWSDVYTTHGGCRCKSDSNCKTDASEGFKCDYCRTVGSCGSWSFLGRWDYCDYRATTVQDYISRSSSTKLDYYWNKVIANRTRAPGFPLFSNLLSSVRTTFDNYRPEMPRGREKMIHSIGSVCKVVQVIENSPYTGLLADGRHEGLIRMGGAVDPNMFGGGVTPGLGFKFPRSGVHDGDFVMLHSLAFGDQWNFFALNQSNHVGVVGGASAVLVAKFKEASQCPFQIGISDLATYSQDGTQHSPARFPFKLMMIPNPSIKTGQGEHNLDAMHAEIDALPVGTTLYTTYACQRPEGDESDPTKDLSKCGEPLLLGDVVTTSECTTSKYGDGSLHIRHQRIEEDWQLEPAFFLQGDYYAGEACGGTVINPDQPPELCTQAGMLSTDAAAQ